MFDEKGFIQTNESKISKKAVKHGIKTVFILFIFSLVCCGVLTKVDLDPDSRDFYETARLIMTKQEKKIFAHLPDEESRKEFIKDFWEKRNPDSETEENEFREEFYRRIEYANARFKEGMPGWKTDRGRIYIYFGTPDQVDMRPMLSLTDEMGRIREARGYLIWRYYRYGFAILFLDKRGDGSYVFDPYYGIGGDFFYALERAKFGLPPKTQDLEKKFLDFDLEYNKEKKEILISIPVNTLTFVSEDDLLKADFDFKFFVYRKKSTERHSFRESRHFEMPEEKVVKLENIEFAFSFPELGPGNYYVDVVVIGKPDIGRARKIFEIKVRNSVSQLVN